MSLVDGTPTTRTLLTPELAGPSPLVEAVLKMPGGKLLRERLGMTEVRRRMWHMAPGLLPLLLWVIPHQQDPWGVILRAVVLVLAVSIIGMMILRFRAIARSQEQSGIAAVAGYSIVILAALYFLPGREEIALMILGILAFGDGTATLTGLAFGGRKLPWNLRKSWIGLASFAVFGGMVGGIYLWGEGTPLIPLPIAFTISAMAAAAAGVVESLPLPGNDNFRVGLTAALVGLAAHSWLVPVW